MWPLPETKLRLIAFQRKDSCKVADHVDELAVRGKDDFLELRLFE
jgi:hypothetical protein